MNKTIKFLCLSLAATLFFLSSTGQGIKHPPVKIGGAVQYNQMPGYLAPYLTTSNAAATYVTIPRLNDSTAALRTFVMGLYNVLLDSLAQHREDIGTGGPGVVTETDPTVGAHIKAITTQQLAEFAYAYAQSVKSYYLTNPVPVTNFDSLFYRKNDSNGVFKLIRVDVASNKLSRTRAISDTTISYLFDVVEANLTLDNIGGTLGNNKLATMPANTIKGNNTGSTASPINLTVAELRTLLSINNVANVDQTNAANITSGSIPTGRFGATTVPLSALVTSGGTDGQVIKRVAGVLVFANDETGGGGVSDGDKGDITISSAGTVYTIDNNAVTTAKINDGAVTSAKIETVISGKEIVRRVLTESSTAASINIDNYDVLVLTNASVATLTITGTPYDGQVFEVIATNGGGIGGVMIAPPDINVGNPVTIGAYKFYRFQYNDANTVWVNISTDRITENDYNKLFTLQSNANPTGTITHNANSGSRHRITFTATGGRTLAFSNITNGYLVTFYIDNTSGSTVTLTLPSNSYVQNTSGVYVSAASVTVPTGKTSMSLNLYDGTNYWFTTSY